MLDSLELKQVQDFLTTSLPNLVTSTHLLTSSQQSKNGFIIVKQNLNWLLLIQVGSYYSSKYLN